MFVKRLQTNNSQDSLMFMLLNSLFYVILWLSIFDTDIMSVGHHTSSMRMHLGLDEAEGTHRMCKSQEEWAPRSKDKKVVTIPTSTYTAK